jgi:sortase A
MVALVCLWVAAQLVWFGGISEARAQHLLYDRFRTELAAATAPVGPVTPVGDPVAYLDIPRLGLHQVVVEGTASGDLLAGPGHLRDTVLPGQVGTSVVLGRAATYGAPFRDVPSLGVGDRLAVTMAQGRRVFHVIGVRRAGDRLPRPPAAGVARLTLVTAEGSGRMGDIAPGRVVYVDAEAAKGFPAPAGLPSAVPTPETVMRSDPGALPSLGRWPAVRVWVVACAPAVALAWLTTDVGMRLLPNLM